MACFYAMDELDIPFAQEAVYGHRRRVVRHERLASFNVLVPVFDEPDPDAENRHHSFFTLRVCKRCRSDWMHGIKRWYDNGYLVTDEPTEGVFVRDLGRTRLATDDEIAAMTAERSATDGHTKKEGLGG